jgi:hypothetical protein
MFVLYLFYDEPCLRKVMKFGFSCVLDGGRHNLDDHNLLHFHYFQIYRISSNKRRGFFFQISLFRKEK